MANLRISVWVPRALGMSLLGIILSVLGGELGVLDPELGRIITLGGMLVAGIGLLLAREDRPADADKDAQEAVSWF